MSIAFPNPSRSYDASRHGVYFWGYDNSREIAFIVEEAMLSRLSPTMGAGEQAALVAFDRHREGILARAKTLYSGGPQNLYTIS